MAPTADRRRLFFALWPDDRLRSAITQAAFAIARERAIGGREIPPERAHLTLLFLGEVTARTEEVIVAGAGRLKAAAFDLMLDQAGCFFRSRAFWVGATATPRKLAALHAGLLQVSVAAGLRPDARALAPHVTCLRDIRHRIRPVPLAPIRWPVREYALVRSILGAEPEYHVVSHWPLQT